MPRALIRRGAGRLTTRLAALLPALLVLGGCATAEPAPPGGRYSFGLWGDMPYHRFGDEARLPAVLASLNRADLAFTIHIGDIKDGGSKCVDAVYTDALRMFGQLQRPAVYLPGDNEWTDCHRLSNGGFDALERLAHLRRVMYPSLDSLGQQPMALEHQGGLGQPYVENLRFSLGPVLYVGLNVPGSNNNLVLDERECSDRSARRAPQCEAANAEQRERDDANLAWLQQSFDLARERGLRGIAIAFQADPGFDLAETEGVDESQAPGYRGYRRLMAGIARLTADFDGQVLLLHGDTHVFKHDQPLHGPTRLLPNFSRVETFGSPLLHWVRITVDPGSAALFQVEPVIVP
ncbi:MAG: hypothetical protein RJA44_360 [Pseudomonadota bacterium]